MSNAKAPRELSRKRLEQLIRIRQKQVELWRNELDYVERQLYNAVSKATIAEKELERRKMADLVKGVEE